jgi:SAM-dependent methyltransferase
MTTHPYVHGYGGEERQRLQDQASTLADLLHHDTRYAAGETVLEAGCGVGAQTVILARNSPEALFTSIDRNHVSLDAARAAVAREGVGNVTFRVANIFDLPFEPDSFDHVFVCFVLEHLAEPEAALQCLRAVLKPGGTLTVIEGDHGSAFYYPRSEAAQRTIDCLIDAQTRMGGGNALIGRELYPLLRRAGWHDARITPRTVYVDASRPEWVEGFTLNTFTAMVAGAREEAIAQGLIDVATWERGIADLERTAEADGVFNYTFFKGVATKEQA